MKAFYNGKVLSEQDIHISIFDRGWLYGDGFFTTLKAINSNLMHFEKHFNRLKMTAEALGIPLAYNENELRDHCKGLLVTNNLLQSTALLKITISRGVSPRGISIPATVIPTCLITTAEYHESINSPRACITSTQRNERSPLMQYKTLNYLEPILARKEAQSLGSDEGILLNSKGLLTEATVANLFFVNNGSVLTPPIKDGVLPGILRGIIIEICQELGIDIQETSIRPEHIKNMDEAFLTNSLIEIQSLSYIDNHKLLHNEDAIITGKIKLAYKKIRDEIAQQ
ncbi:MAG: aminotransferase class IV [Gammaproteobacteria bacterium]|nr:aminotransferase class IV [Gammaproteobacteria bacterium]